MCTGTAGFGLSGPVEGHRDEQLHLKGSTGVCLAGPLRFIQPPQNVMKIERTIVKHVVSVFVRII